MYCFSLFVLFFELLSLGENSQILQFRRVDFDKSGAEIKTKPVRNMLECINMCVSGFYLLGCVRVNLEKDECFFHLENFYELTDLTEDKYGYQIVKGRSIQILVEH